MRAGGAGGAVSYARFSADSDVYVYLDVGGYLRCCGCVLAPSADDRFYSTDAMLSHLAHHAEAGHDVPAACREGLDADREENDQFIAGGGRG